MIHFIEGGRNGWLDCHGDGGGNHSVVDALLARSDTDDVSEILHTLDNLGRISQIPKNVANMVDLLRQGTASSESARRVWPCCARIALCMACGLPQWFDAHEYLRLTPDLEEAEFTPRLAIAHFVNHGHGEHRDHSAVSASGLSNGQGSCGVVVAIDNYDTYKAIEYATLLESEGVFSMAICLIPEDGRQWVRRGNDSVEIARHFGSPIVLSAYAKILNPRLIRIFGDDEGKWTASAAPEYAHKCVPWRYGDGAAYDEAPRRELCVLSYLYREDCHDASAPYFRALLRTLRIARGRGVRFVLALALFDVDHDAEAGHSFRKLSDIETAFGFSYDPQPEAREFALSFGSDGVIYVPNKGLDYGPFFVALRLYMVPDMRSVTKIHCKTNLQWRESIVKACYVKPEPEEVVVSGRWWNAISSGDRNASNVKSLASTLGMHDKVENYSFPAGSILTIPRSILDRIVERFDDVYGDLTGRGKVDWFWLDAMRDENFYVEEMARLAKCPYNSPVPDNCLEVLERSGANNYIELLDAGVRGIHDCMIEHAWERVLGLLIHASACRVKLV